MNNQISLRFEILAQIRELNAELLNESHWLSRLEREGETEAAAAHSLTVREIERDIARLEARLKGMQS